MLVGHVAAALVGKRIAPKVSLGTLMLAAVAADLLWCVFLIGGIERVQISPGTRVQDSLVATYIAYSHSLLMDAVWAVCFGAAYFLRRRNLHGTWVVAAVVLSHWLLDFVSHRPDMPLAPGVRGHFGLGLWDSVVATLLVEGGFWLLAIILYIRATHPGKRAGLYGFWIGIALITAAWLNNIAGPPPSPGEGNVAIPSLIFFALVVAWAYWMNRARPAEI